MAVALTSAHSASLPDWIGLRDFCRQWQDVAADVHAAVELIGSNGHYILDRAVQDFEQSLARRIGVPWCVGVGNGHDAIEIALKSLGLEPGQRVLTTPLSAFATTQAILRANGAPVFVDVDASGLLDLTLCEEAISDDPTIRFLLPVHLWGHSLDLDHLERLRDESGITVVEDCAQSIDARWNGRQTGTVGHATALSFYPTKNLGTLGDGGAVLTPSPTVRDLARCLRAYGQTTTPFVHDTVGLNSRLDELHAAILETAMLPRLESWTERRREIAHIYCEGINHRLITIPPVARGNEPNWHLFPILVDEGRREAFRAHMDGQGIGTAVHYPRLIPDQKALSGQPEVRIIGRLENARSFARKEVSLPMHPYLTDEEINRVVAACYRWRP